MKNKYIIKLYHYYLKKKYDNDKIVGIKESEKVLEKLKNLSVIEPISINDLDYMGKAFLNDLSSEYPKDSLKIFKMVKNGTTDIFYKYHRERYVGKVCIYIFLSEDNSLHSNCDLLECKLEIMKGINKSEIDKKSHIYWRYLETMHQYDIMVKETKSNFKEKFFNKNKTEGKMRIAIVDDELIWRKKSYSYIKKIVEKNDSIDVFKSGNDFLEKHAEYDIVFMDIEMPEIDGWNTAKTYRIFYPESVVAMLTTHDEMCSKGYHINAFRFISKQNMEYELSEALSSLRKILRKDKQIELKVRSLKTLKVNINNIIYVETIKHNTLVHLRGNNYVCTQTMKEMCNLLENEGFFKCHQSYLVNLDDVLTSNSSIFFTECAFIRPLLHLIFIFFMKIFIICMTRAKKQKEKNKMNYKKIVTFLTITALATSGPFKLTNPPQVKLSIK